MGKALIVKGANFEENGIQLFDTELIYDGITGKTSTVGWASPNVDGLVPVATGYDITGKKVTKVIVRRNGTASQDIGIFKFNTSTNAFTLLYTIPSSVFNSQVDTECNIGIVEFGENEVLGIGATGRNVGTGGCCIALCAGTADSNGMRAIGKGGGIDSPRYDYAIMCKIYAIVE